MYDTTEQKDTWIGCNGCGNCCEDIPINFTMKELKDNAAKNPDSPDLQEDAAILPVIWYKQKGFYQCRMFDRENRTCKIHDSKPPICRNFPFYGKMSPGKQEFDCSFNKLLPIVQVT